ncbi:cytoplasmic polyadenylation element-binding protein 1 [Sitophilus oryzae]|uniref:Cytoplasmic polyadenylation element-binding protein 1 n=1 Tax=Sitophilus oryzae TaxID=7048 RepID=A0A6J2Y1S2_SITOR|nr:cytoplasmic polyadenylation element-binding protein 1 [Sitophilus oryzae]
MAVLQSRVEVLPSDANSYELSLNILQKHSINSLLNFDNNSTMPPNKSETMNDISDLLGLNSPRGLLNLNPSEGLCTPPASPHNMQINFDDSKSQGGYYAPSCVKSLQRNLSLGSAGSSPATPTYLSRTFRSTSLSDSCGSNSPAIIDQHFLNRSNSNSPESDYPASINSPELAELLGSLNINDTASRNPLNGAANNSLDWDLSNIQNLQALRYLQQTSPAVYNSLFPYGNPFAPQIVNKWSNNTSVLNSVPEAFYLDRAVRFHRFAASVYDAVCTWSGVLPLRNEKPTGYSSKVFLGGVPWDISEQCLIQAFRQFGPIKVEWPRKGRLSSQPKGYVYIIFESDKCVKALLQACTNHYGNNGNLYYKIGSKRMKSKDVQVIPWYLSDSNYTKSTSQKLDPSKTVFVGALHGMLNAQGLANIMNDLFEGVVYAGIDTDKYKYPIGSGRVTFNNPRSYLRAVSAAFIEIKTAKFTKKVQVDPYLEDSLCTFCGVQQGPYFCREFTCFRYFCHSCWSFQHGSELRHHNPMSRNSKNNQVMGLGSTTPNVSF